MNLLIKISVLLLVDYFLFRLGFYFGMLGLIIVIYRILNILGFFRSPTLGRSGFSSGNVFLKDYEGPYSNSGVCFEEVVKILKKFKIDEGKLKYVPIGLYYDNPGEVEDSKLRYSIGFYQRELGFPENPPKELENYCKENNYYFSRLSTVDTLFSSWEYFTFFTLIKGIKKFYNILSNKLNDASFIKTFRIPKGTKCDIIIELYESDSKISFYAPIKNISDFQLYKKDTKTN